MDYKCVKCGRGVVVNAGEVIRLCDCPADTGVTADASARMTGKASVCSEG